VFIDQQGFPMSGSAAGQAAQQRDAEVERNHAEHPVLFIHRRREGDHQVLAAGILVQAGDDLPALRVGSARASCQNGLSKKALS